MGFTMGDQGSGGFIERCFRGNDFGQVNLLGICTACFSPLQERLLVRLSKSFKFFAVHPIQILSD
jgi:hypothetical protein